MVAYVFAPLPISRIVTFAGTTKCAGNVFECLLYAFVELVMLACLWWIYDRENACTDNFENIVRLF